MVRERKSTEQSVAAWGPGGGDAPARGRVLGERYELEECVLRAAMAFDYRAVDQEHERDVMVRIANPATLGTERVAEEVLTRLRRVVGKGSRPLGALIDVDREGALVYAVEPWPEGTSLRDVLSSRAERSERFTPVELLPVAQQLSLALQAMPEGWHHGELRTDRIWVHASRLILTGPYLAAALPRQARILAAQVDVWLATQMAPEFARGESGIASDVYAAGRVLLEVICADPSHTDIDHAVAFEKLPSTRQALQSMLARNAAERPLTLDPLIDALARDGGERPSSRPPPPPPRPPSRPPPPPPSRPPPPPPSRPPPPPPSRPPPPPSPSRPPPPPPSRPPSVASSPVAEVKPIPRPQVGTPSAGSPGDEGPSLFDDSRINPPQRATDARVLETARSEAAPPPSATATASARLPPAHVSLPDTGRATGRAILLVAALLSVLILLLGTLIANYRNKKAAREDREAQIQRRLEELRTGDTR